MPGFDDLLNRAKELVGEETVNEIVKEVEKRSESDHREIVNVERADLSPLVSKIARVASEKPNAVGELIREAVKNLEVSDVNPKATPIVPAEVASPQPSPVSQVEELKNNLTEPVNPVPSASGTAMVIAESIKGEYRYAMLGLLLGLASIIGGVVLGLNGVAGSTSWTANLLGLKSQVNDAAPGVVLFIIGLFMIVATRPNVNLKDLRG